MKKILMVLMGVCWCACVWANPIDQQKARKTAGAFLQEVGRGAIHEKKMLREVSLGRVERKAQPFYVFNCESDGGFVIVAGDDCAVPILGYALSGSFRTDSLPENLRAWLQGYADEIAWMQEHGYTEDRQLAAEARRKAATRSNVGILCKSLWNQSAPYNNNCPVYSGSSRAVTGCVATAIAQVMYYHRFPAKPLKTIPAYVSKAYGLSMPALEPVGFDWGNMQDCYGTYYAEGSSRSSTQSYSTVAAAAVATLMQYCGAAVQMSYGSSSSAYDTSVAQALKDYFGYDRRTRFVNRRDVTTLEWADTIYGELAAGRPVVFNGQSSSGGHCFVCDGYQSSTDKYHFNFGWGGQSNGYFALTAVYQNGTSGYNKMQSVTIGIEPPTSEDYDVDGDGLTVSELAVMSGKTINRQARSADSEVVLTAVMRNNTGRTLTYDIAMGLYDVDGTLLDVYGAETREMVGGDAYTANDHRYYQHLGYFGAELPYGIYYLYPVCRQAGTDTWYKAGGTAINHVTATVGKESIVLQQANDLNISVAQTYNSRTRTYTTTATLVNKGTEEFDDELFIYVDGSLKNYIEPIIPAGESTTVTISDFTYSTSSSSHTLKICGGIYGDGSLYPIIYYANTQLSQLALSHEWGGYVDDGCLFGDTYDYVLTASNVGNATFSGAVKATLYDAAKNYSAGQSKAITANIAPGESAQLAFHFTSLTYGTTYCLRIEYTDQASRTLVLGEGEWAGKAITPTRGIVAVGTEGIKFMKDSGTDFVIPDDAAYADVRYSDRASSVVCGNSPNTLYLLAEGSDIPENMKGRNVVVGTSAATIRLSDGYSFASPIDIVADNISFYKVFEEGYEGDGRQPWSTIALPFDVQAVTVGPESETISWFHSADDANGRFWVMDFEGEGNDRSTLAFDYAMTMDAYRPYLVMVPTSTSDGCKGLSGQGITFRGSQTVVKAAPCKAVNERFGRFDFIGKTLATHHWFYHEAEGSGPYFIAHPNKGIATPFSGLLLSAKT